MTDESSFLRRQARTQRFTLGAPKNPRVSPDGKRVLFLRAESDTDRRQSLFSVEIASGTETKLVDAVELLPGEEQLPPEERARRERTRETSGGVVGYATDAAARIVAFSLSGRLYTLDTETGATAVLAEHAVLDPRPNPPGTHVAYVRDRRLRVVERATGTEHTPVDEAETGDAIAWGLAEFVAAEEMGRTRGYWWSPDGQQLLIARTDRSAVPRWTIADPAHPEHPANVVSYPAAGESNVDVSLALVGLDGSRVDVERGDWEYLAAVHWSAGGPPLLAVQSRDQRTMHLLVVHPDGRTEVRHTETDPHWVDIVPGLPAWTPDGALVHASAADGTHRLVVDGRPVTPPGLNLRAVSDVGVEILFTASAEDPTQIHAYRTHDGELQRLSTTDGVHGAAGTTETTVLTSWTMERSGPDVRVLREGTAVAEIASPTADPGLLPHVEWLTLGERVLRAALLRPTGHTAADGPLPVLLDPYGGPHAQRVLRTRNAMLTPQWLADQGFAVLVVDGRGTPGRGPAWERAIAGTLAEVTLTDQVDALHAAAERFPELDLTRVGIRGWSYGGYLSALAVLRRPDVFHAAIAGAPVTDWALYDTHYTERYLGTPQTDPQTYRANSLLADAEHLRRALLIVHGLADDNVFVAHSLRLSAALLAAGRAHTFLPLAGATHISPQTEREAENLMLTQIQWLTRELENAR